MKKLELVFALLRIPFDFFLALLAILGAYIFRTQYMDMGDFYFPNLHDFTITALFTSLVFVVVMLLLGGYTLERQKSIGKQIREIFTASLIWLGVNMGILFFFREEFFSRLIVVYALIGMFVFVSLGRVVLDFFLLIFKKKYLPKERILFVGINDITLELYHSFKKSADKIVVGGVKSRKSEQENDIKILGEAQDLEQIIKKHKITKIIQTANISSELELNLVEFCHSRHINFVFVPDMLMLKRTNVETFFINGIPMIEMRLNALSGFGRVIKRILDIVFSFCGLVVLSPIFLIIAIAIKVDSRGPVFFSKLPDGTPVRRVGQGGELIPFLKFRSMRDNSHNERYEMTEKSHRKGPLVKIKGDMRITGVGKFIRRYSLDELPQLVNVFFGDLSLVGPRPHLPEEVEKYTQSQKKVLNIKPGITGISQVSGRSDLQFDDEAKLDIWYIDNWSLWLDVKIVVKTFFVVIKGNGAD